MKQELVEQSKEQPVFLLSGTEFDCYKTQEALRAKLLILAERAEMINTNIPISLMIAHWPPAAIILADMLNDQQMIMLYEALRSTFEVSGYSVGVLTNLEVFKHEPESFTALRADGKFRVVSLH